MIECCSDPRLDEMFGVCLPYFISVILGRFYFSRLWRTPRRMTCAYFGLYTARFLFYISTCGTGTILFLYYKHRDNLLSARPVRFFQILQKTEDSIDRPHFQAGIYYVTRRQLFPKKPTLTVPQIRGFDNPPLWITPFSSVSCRPGQPPDEFYCNPIAMRTSCHMILLLLLAVGTSSVSAIPSLRTKRIQSSITNTVIVADADNHWCAYHHHHHDAT